MGVVRPLDAAESKEGVENMSAVSSQDRRKQVRTSVRSPFTTVVARLVTLFFGIVIAFLALRFLLLLIGANESAPIVSFIYSVAGVFLAPIGAVLPQTDVSGSTFEWTTLFAMLIYALISWGIVALLDVMFAGKRTVVVERDVEEEKEEHRI